MTTPEQTPSTPPFLDDRALAGIVFGLYLVALGTAFTALIGFAIAYFARPQAEPMTASHFTFQLRTVLIGVGYVIVGAILTLVWVGYLILAWWYVWSLIRSVKGLLALNRRQPIQNPQSWRFG
jgi:uncharacterized membrane protein